MTNGTCPSCGAPLSPGTFFCGSCGTRITLEQQPAPEPAPNEPPAFAPIAADYEPPPSMFAPAQGAPAALALQVDPLVGEPTTNETYSGNRLSYADHSADFDPINSRSYLWALLVRYLVFLLIWTVGMVVFFLVFGIAGINLAVPDEFDFSNGELSGGSRGLYNFWLLLMLVWSVGLTAVFWLTPLPARLSEWMCTVDGQADSALPALEHMLTIIQVRRPPLPNLEVLQLVAQGQPGRHYLQLRTAPHVGYVTAFAYGTDLFLGWTMWINLSPVGWLWMNIVRMFRGLSRSRPGILQVLAYDQPKAMREVMHSAVRQGLDVASGDVVPAGQGVIGAVVPVTVVQP